MELVTMKAASDCEVAALATVCGVSYDDARCALGWRVLPFGLENPVFGNPHNLYRALVKLGHWKRNITLTQLLTSAAEPGKSVVLLHSLNAPTLMSHWVVWLGRVGEKHKFAWGTSTTPVLMSDAELAKMYTGGWPNCAFQVYKANLFDLLWARVRLKIKEWLS